MEQTIPKKKILLRKKLVLIDGQRNNPCHLIKFLSVPGVWRNYPPPSHIHNGPYHEFN